MSFTHLILAIAAPVAMPAFTLQGSVTTAEAIRNDDPETWVVEYPRIILPFVVRYRRCLNLTDRRVTGAADFQAQHRSDVPRCAKERKAATADAIEAMEGAKTYISQEQLTAVFDTLEAIHVARGRDLDDQFKQRVAASEKAGREYFENRPEGLVLELPDATVVKSLDDVQATDQQPNEEKAVN